MSLCTHGWQETLWIDFIFNLEMFVREIHDMRGVDKLTKS